MSDIVANEICNDEANIPECNFDGGDCCLIPLNINECSKCECYVNGVITSEKFPNINEPGSYTDLTWLIQLPIGQYIKIEFPRFDVQSCRYVFHVMSLFK